jgi:SAM-dependent methyltransferase
MTPEYLRWGRDQRGERGSVPLFGQCALLRAGPRRVSAALATAFAAEPALDGTGRLLDVGCGPGSLTLLSAGSFEEAAGLDADADMLAALAGIGNCRWVHRRAEELPAGLGRFRLVTFAQSFHWFDRARVAAAVRGLLAPGGACAHVHATTHEGVESSVPRAEITELRLCEIAVDLGFESFVDCHQGLLS